MVNPKLLPLAVLHASDDGTVEGITRFQKLVFLLQKEKEIEGYHFDKHNYGPFSKELYTHIEIFENTNYIDHEVTRTQTGNEKNIYRLNEDGQRIIEEALSQGIDGIDLDEIKEVVQEYNDMPLMRLINYVYDNYPDYEANSVLR